MKITIISALIILSNLAYSQWFNNSDTWYFNRQEQLDFQAHGYTKYTVAKDTVVASQTAKLIVVQTIRYNGDTLPFDSLIVYESNNKVYRFNGNSYKLMYDFNLQAGDTLDVDINITSCDSVSPIIVDSVTNVNISGNNLLRQFVSFKGYNSGETETYSFVITEHIGYEGSFIFAPQCSESESFVNTSLRCFETTNFLYKSQWWQTNWTDEACDILINQSGIEKLNKNSCEIYPNPAHNHVTINNIAKYNVVKIIDANGKIAKQYTLQNTENITIDLSDLNKGIYFILMSGNTKYSSNKLIIK